MKAEQIDKLMPAADVAEFVRREQPELALDGVPQVVPITGGASNLTFELRWPDVTLIARRGPPGTKARGAHDMLRESAIIQGLEDVFPKVPRVLARCDDEAVIGAPFFVMEKLEGVIPRQEFPESAAPDSDTCHALCGNFVETWAALHQAQLPESLAQLDRGDGYVERQISGWRKRYEKARTPDAPDLTAVAQWLENRQPADQPHGLIHNDYRLDNLVLDPGDLSHIKGVLDWELATVGDPLMDLGASLAYWIGPDDEPAFHGLRRQPTHLPGMWSREQIVARYRELCGMESVEFRFYEIYGLFRLAGIAQQIYYRHYHGQFRSDAFANFIDGVRYLGSRCERMIAGKL